MKKNQSYQIKIIWLACLKRSRALDLFAFFPSTLGRTEFRKQAADVVAKAAIKVDHVDDLKRSLPLLKNNDQKKSVIREIDSEIRKGLLLSVHELVRSRPASHVVLVGECHDHTTPETAHSPSARRFLLALTRAAIANPRARVAIEAHAATWDNYRDPLAQKITEISEDDKRSLRWEVDATLAIGALDRVHAMDKRSHASDATDEADQFFEDAAFTLQTSEHSGVIACLREHLAKDGEPDTVGKRRFDLLRRLYPSEATSHYFNVNSVTRLGSVRVLMTTEVVVVYLSQLHPSGHIADLEPLSAYCNAVGCSHSPNPGRLLCTRATLPTNEERRKAVSALAFAAMGCEYSTFNGEPSAARAILGSLGCRTDGADTAVVDRLCYAAEDFMLLPEDNASWRHQRLNTPTQDLLRREVCPRANTPHGRLLHDAPAAPPHRRGRRRLDWRCRKQDQLHVFPVRGCVHGRADGRPHCRQSGKPYLAGLLRPPARSTHTLYAYGAPRLPHAVQRMQEAEICGPQAHSQGRARTLLGSSLYRTPSAAVPQFFAELRLRFRVGCLEHPRGRRLRWQRERRPTPRRQDGAAPSTP